jgi:hypothetical protein
MCYTYDKSLTIVEQIELTPGSIYTLLKPLKQQLFNGFTNNLSIYNGESSSIGIYTSDKCFKPDTNYTPETFFMVVKQSHIFTVHCDIFFPNINDLDKMEFSYDETRQIFHKDPTINAICDIERNFWASVKTRTDTIKLLKEFDPVSTIKWYNFTSTLKQRCSKHMRRMIINILARDIKGEKAANIEKTANTTITTIV